MANDNIYVLDSQTGKEIIRHMTDAEQTARAAEVLIFTQVKAEEEAAALAKKEAAASAVTKLEAIGLTADEIAALRG